MRKALDIREGWKVFSWSDLVDMGKDEFGTPYTGESYYVIIEDKRGRRLAHCHRFDSCQRVETEDGFPFFADKREHAQKEVDTLVARVVDAGKIDMDYWTEIEPAYGSEHYCKVNGF